MYDSPINTSAAALDKKRSLNETRYPRHTSKAITNVVFHNFQQIEEFTSHGFLSSDETFLLKGTEISDQFKFEIL